MNGKVWAERIIFVLGIASFLFLVRYESYIAPTGTNQPASARCEISPPWPATWGIRFISDSNQPASIAFPPQTSKSRLCTPELRAIQPGGKT
jgi:hypothetical protein